MRGTKGVLDVLVIMAAVVAGATPAHADDACVAEARAFDKNDASLAPPGDRAAARHVREGNKRHRVLKYAEAIDEYVAASLLDPAPSIHYNLGQSYRLSGQYENAILQYRLFVDRGAPGLAVRRLVECHIERMRSELQRSASTAPPTGPAPEGTSQASIAAPPLSESAMEGAGQVEPWYQDRLGLGLAGLGIVVAGAGAWLLADAASLDDDANHEHRDDVRVDLRDQSDSRRTWGTVGTGVGAVALVAGVVKLAITPDAPRAAERSASVSFSPSGILLQGRF